MVHHEWFTMNGIVGLESTVFGKRFKERPSVLLRFAWNGH
jgi:hypothetical protein